MLETPPPDAPADLVTAWAAMCAPVRQRYATEGRRHRLRALLRRWLEWEARRRGRAVGVKAAVASLPPDARILAIQPDHLGGHLLTTAAYQRLKAALPTARLTVLSGPWAADVPERCAAVDDVRVYRFPGFERDGAVGGNRIAQAIGRGQHMLRPYVQALALADLLRGEHYHAAINFHADFWWGAAVAALAAIPVRIGYASPGAAPFLTHARPLEVLRVGKSGGAARPHVAATQVALTNDTLALAQREASRDAHAPMAFEPTADDRADAWRLWRANDLDEAAAVVALHPAPGAAPKRWSPDRFVWVADHLAGRYGATVVITGGPGDVEEARAIGAACRHRPVVLAGQTSFGVLSALFDRCKLVVGTDNGALHLASARSVPNLRLFGPTDAASWGGWPGVRGEAMADSLLSPRECSPCHRLDVPPWEQASPGSGVAYPCMQDITADQVIASLERIWQELPA